MKIIELEDKSDKGKLSKKQAKNSKKEKDENPNGITIFKAKNIAVRFRAVLAHFDLNDKHFKNDINNLKYKNRKR